MRLHGVLIKSAFQIELVRAVVVAKKVAMDEDQLLDYEEEQEETTDGNKAENGSAADKKIKVL